MTNTRSPRRHQNPPRPPVAIPRSRPGPIFRRLARFPTWLYPLHLGRLLGNRFLMVTHRGRITGRLLGTTFDGSDDAITALAEHCPAVAFRPSAAATTHEHD